MNKVRIRKARDTEATELTSLCLRSKAHWGYDAAFLKASEPSLTVSESRIAAGRVLVAEEDEGQLLGVAASDPLKNGVFDLALLFVEPRATGAGVGAALFAAAVAQIKREGATRLRIEADPFAEGFYLGLGAKRIGETPSNAIPGRMLPLLEFAID